MFSCILQLNEMSRREWQWEGMGMSYREQSFIIIHFNSGSKAHKHTDNRQTDRQTRAMPVPIREWDRFFKCENFGNGNGKDLAGMGGD